MVIFLRPVGAHADVRELEYISSLHQTQSDYLRADGSIDAEDISLYLLSRHSIKLEEELIVNRILNGEDRLDLVQLLCMLQIPELIEHATDHDDELIPRVHQVIMNATEGDWTAQPQLTTDSLRQIMEYYGEYGMTDDILDEMIASITSSNSGTTTSSTSTTTSPSSSSNCFTAEAFKKALIGDVEQHYSTKWKDKLSTHYDDVRLSTPGNPLLDECQDVGDVGLIRSHVVMLESKLLLENLKNGTVKTFRLFSSSLRPEESSKSDDNDDGIESSTPMTLPIRSFSAPAIDQVADTYRSLTFQNLLWITFVVTYLAYLWQVDKNVGRFNCLTEKGDTAPFGCLVANSITRWLFIFFQLSVVGTAFVFLASLGNDTYTSNRCHSIGFTMIGMVSIFLFTGLTFFVKFNGYIVDTRQKDNLKFIYAAALTMGIILLALQLIHLLRLLYPDPKLKWVDNILTPSITKAEVQIKHAATFKMKKLLKNALTLHEGENIRKESMKSSSPFSSRTGAFGQALLSYQLSEGMTEPSGGLWWAWKRYWSGAITYEDGIWIHSRLVASNIAQWFICFAILLGGAFTIDALANGFVEGTKSIKCSSVENYDFTTIDLWHLKISLSIGLASGFSAAVWVTVVYIPSFISTVIAFRTGARLSLRDPEFLRHRYSVDNATLLFGCALWGALFTGLIFLVLVGSFSFLFFWTQTRNSALIILAQVIGICVTYTLKILVLFFLRTSFFHAFYRIRPAASNVMGVVLECWNLGLSPGFITARAGQILLLSIIYVGRMDTDFLAKGVATFGPVSLDTYSLTFRKDLLVHEAHRHPYIERLGVMYMLKLRYGKAFMTRAGKYWRILFTLALMPWMRKYRLLSLPSPEAIEQEIEQVEEAINAEKEILGDSPSKIKGRKTLVRLKSLKVNAIDNNRMDMFASREGYLEAQNELLRSKNAVLTMKLAVCKAKEMTRKLSLEKVLNSGEEKDA